MWRASWCGPDPNQRGVNTLLINPFNCSVQESRQFDTYAWVNDATQLGAYSRIAFRKIRRTFAHRVLVVCHKKYSSQLLKQLQ